MTVLEPCGGSSPVRPLVQKHFGDVPTVDQLSFTDRPMGSARNVTVIGSTDGAGSGDGAGCGGGAGD